MNIFSKIVDYLLPRRCIFCNTPVYGPEPFCENCRELVPTAEGICPRCGKRPCVCGERRFAFSSVVPVFFYELGAQNAVKQLKFNERTSYAKPLAKYMYGRLVTRDFYPRLEAIIPVPMTKRAIHQRGYNQSVLLAKELSRLSGIPAECNILQKVRETQKQHDLTERERRSNLNEAFAVADPVKLTGKTVLLCDDVYTTGATFDECARTLLSGGAREVFCAAISTTMNRRHSDEG